MPDQTINKEQNERAEQWKKTKPSVVAAFVMLCLYAIFDGVPNPPLAVFFGLAACYALIHKWIDMKTLLTLFNYITQVCTIAALTLVLMFFVQEAREEIKSYEEPDYADTKGCSPDVWYDYQACG